MRRVLASVVILVVSAILFVSAARALAPRTFMTGDPILAADFSTLWDTVDNLNDPIAELTLSANNALLNSTSLIVPLTPASSGCSNGYETTDAGWYLIQATADFESNPPTNPAEEVRLQLRIDGSRVQLQEMSFSSNQILSVALSGSHLAQLNAGNCIQLVVFQESGSSAWEVVGGGETYMQVLRLRP